MSEIEKQARLRPYKIEQVTAKANEIPEGVAQINAPEIWSDNKGEGIVIAIIDTGIDKNHPELMQAVIGGYNFTTSQVDDYQDREGHGTHVAGTIGARINDSGVVGVAPECKLLILKALDDEGSGYLSWITSAINYAIDWRGPGGEKVSVISMSLGGPDSDAEHEAIKRAVSEDILVICAAGNEGDNDFNTDELSYPASYPEVVSVGAVDFNDIPADFTNTNEEVDLVAPGVSINSTYINSNYAVLSGTSMATPHAAAAAALLKNKLTKEFQRNLTESELYAQLIKHTKTLNLDRRVQGNGVLDLLAVPTPIKEPIPETPEIPEIPKKIHEVIVSVNIENKIKIRKRKNSVAISWEE
jgi:major intracellular serine protease